MVKQGIFGKIKKEFGLKYKNSFPHSFSILENIHPHIKYKGISIMKKASLLCLFFMVYANKPYEALENGNTRSFQFTYTVDIESTNGKKLEVWLPVPQSNEVQIISKLKVNTNSYYSVCVSLNKVCNLNF